MFDEPLLIFTIVLGVLFLGTAYWVVVKNCGDDDE